MAALLKGLSLLSAACATLALCAGVAVQGQQDIEVEYRAEVEAFSDICVANAESLSAARQSAISEPWNFAYDGSLPGYGSAPDMQVYTSGDLGLLLRPNRNRFGCLMTIVVTDDDGTILVNEVSMIEGLTPKGKHRPGKDQYKWDLTGPHDAEVVLSIYTGREPVTAILALESKGNPN